MRSYDVAIASLAIGSPAKWTDNLLSQHIIPDVISARRGVPRRITYAALVRLAVIRELNQRLGVGVADAVAMADQVLFAGADGVITVGPIRVEIDLSAVERALMQRLGDALESAPVSRRGRPRKRGGM